MLDGIDLKLVLIVLTFAAFAAVHATLIDGIRQSAPDLLPRLGWLGPLYWWGPFVWRPAYRKFLKNGEFDAEISAHPSLLRLAQIERLLWYVQFAIVLVAIAWRN